MNLTQALAIAKDHIRIGKGMELTNGVPEALEMVVEELEQLQKSDADKERYIIELYNRAKEAESELTRYKRALELACKHLTSTNSGEYCPADYITHDGALCAEKQPCSGKEKECWGEYFLAQAKAGDE